MKTLLYATTTPYNTIAKQGLVGGGEGEWGSHQKLIVPNMHSRCQAKPIENVEMWLAVQYWQLYYNNEYDESRPEKKDQNKNKRVTFNDVKEIREIHTENQMYFKEDEINKTPKIKKP